MLKEENSLLQLANKLECMKGVFYLIESVKSGKTTKIIALILSVIMLLSAVNYSSFVNTNAANTDSSQKAGVYVSVKQSNISIKIVNVGKSGKAYLYRFRSNEYFSADKIKGIITSSSAGTKLSAYTCGTTKTVTTSRYEKSGEDLLYCKYYVIQGTKIIAGPVYATDIYAPKSNVTLDSKTKKGVITDGTDPLSNAKDLGAGWTVLNVNLDNLVYANEYREQKTRTVKVKQKVKQYTNAAKTKYKWVTKTVTKTEKYWQWNKIDNSKRGNAVRFVSGGNTYYFNSTMVKYYDNLVKSYTDAGINVTMVVIAWQTTNYKSYPRHLIYVEDNLYTMGFNTADSYGRNYWIAIMEFLASRYNDASKNGLVNNFIIGNEIDYAFDYHKITNYSVSGNQIVPKKKSNGEYYEYRCSLDTYMEEYARELRLANLAVKKYASGMSVSIPLTHSWANNIYDNVNHSNKVYGKMNVHYNSYAPKLMLDWLNKYTKLRGDYDWGIASHPYCAVNYHGDVLALDTGALDKSEWTSYVYNTKTGAYISGNYNTTPFITTSNFEVMQLYLNQSKLKFNGKVRNVYLTETGISSYCNTAEDLKQQAASVANYYYRCASLECVKAIMYHRVSDFRNEGGITNTLKLGLKTEKEKKKPSYDVWKYIDTDLSSQYADRYLSSIKYKKDGKIYSVKGGNIKSYFDTMAVVNCSYDWKANWDFEKLTPIKTKTQSFVEKSLSLSKEEYMQGEPILVTATGSSTDTVEIYSSIDDLEKAEPIYYYNVNGINGNINHYSGTEYDIKIYGVYNPSRTYFASIPKGSYFVVLRNSDNEIVCSKQISVLKSTTPVVNKLISASKSQYTVGEDIIVTANPNNIAGRKYWVGIYKKGFDYQNNVSIYWYYVNGSNGDYNCVPQVLQKCNFNSGSACPSGTLDAGDYIIRLFYENSSGSYNTVASEEINIKQTKTEGFASVEYALDNITDGFANGKVTVTKKNDNKLITDCVLYWADENSEPIKGYEHLAKFKTPSIKTEIRMYSNTIIPQGAKKLIAFAANGSALSDEFTECVLPENCTYSLGDDYISEFQIISDIHVTTDKGATNEVRYSNVHFKQMLEDVRDNSPKSSGIFINGDMANTGAEDEYKKIAELYYSLNGLPDIHMSIGNHDWIKGNPNNQFQKYVGIFNKRVSPPENVYYDEWINGYHYIYLGGQQAGLHAVLKDEQRAWLDKLLLEDSIKNPGKPVFVFLHQSMYNTVAGSFAGQNWDGVENEPALQAVLKKYDNVIFLNGHSHWELDSTGCMFSGNEDCPVAFNTASVGYLWSSYNIITGEYMEGSHGYFVRIYDDKVVFMGRNFVDGKFMPSALFVVKLNGITVPKTEYTIKKDSNVFNLNAKADKGEILSYYSTDNDIIGVDGFGNVFPKAVGTAYIIVTSAPSNTEVISRQRIKITVK